MNTHKLVTASVLTIALFAAACSSADRNDAVTASGTVEATEADLGFQVPGRVAEVRVREGDVVQKGDQLASLDQQEIRARRDAANAQLEAARAMLAQLEHGARPQEKGQAKAAVEAARRRMEEAQASLARTRKLYEGGAVSKEQLDASETAYTVAKSQAEQAQQQQSLVDVGPRSEQIEAQRAVVRQAEAAVAQVQANLDNAIIIAPFNGIVTVKHREAGESVTPGLPVVTIMNPDDRWVRIYIREDQVGNVHIGEPSVITSDSHPGKKYQGRVTYISTQAEFTPRNVQTSEERVKLVYAVKVAIAGDPQLDLKSGIPADVTLTQVAH